MGRWELVVMAAGVGSRFGGLKQLEPVGPHGEALLDYSVFDAVRAGAQRVIVVLRREMEGEFHAQLGYRWTGRVEVEYAFQELTDLPPGVTVPAGRSKPWGTGHAVLAARRAVRAPFLVINADDFYGAEAFALLAGFLTGAGRGGRYALVAYQLAETLSEHGAVSRGVCRVDEAGRLVGIDERTRVVRRADGSLWSLESGQALQLPPDAPVSMNFWGFGEDVFAHLERRFVSFLGEQGREPDAECFLPAAVTALVQEKVCTVQVLPSRARWFGLTYREDIPLVRRHLQELLRQGAYPSRLWP